MSVMNGKEIRMANRTYFYGADGKELVTFPLNGLPMGSGSSMVIRDGQTLEDTRYAVTVWKGKKEIQVTAADFGGKPTKVKWWYPGTDGAGHSEWFWLIAPEIGDVEASNWPGKFPPKVKFNPATVL